MNLNNYVSPTEKTINELVTKKYTIEELKTIEEFEEWFNAAGYCLEYEIIYGGVRITSYTGSAETLTIPDTIDETLSSNSFIS